MGWDDDHLHRFRIHGRDYGIAYVGEHAASVPLSWFRFCPPERFLYEYDFSAGWQVEMRVEMVRLHSTITAETMRAGVCPRQRP